MSPDDDNREEVVVSFNLWARPVPTGQPEPESLYDIKHALARRLLGGDGSLRTTPTIVTMLDVGAWLEGVRDVGPTGAREAAETLLEMLEANPQGVELWIGDPDDY